MFPHLGSLVPKKKSNTWKIASVWEASWNSFQILKVEFYSHGQLTGRPRVLDPQVKTRKAAVFFSDGLVVGVDRLVDRSWWRHSNDEVDKQGSDGYVKQPHIYSR